MLRDEVGWAVLPGRLGCLDSYEFRYLLFNPFLTLRNPSLVTMFVPREIIATRGHCSTEQLLIGNVVVD